MGRRHDWTLRPELMRRKAVPVGNWPTVADIPPGVLVLDSDGVVKVKRFTVYLNGPDTLTFAPVASNIKDIDWEFSFGFRDDNLAKDVFARYVQFLSGSQPNFVLVANTAGGIDISFRNDGAASVHVMTMTALYNDSKAHHLTVGMRSGLFYAFSDIEAKKTLAVPNWSGIGFTSIVISDHATSIRPLMIFCVRQSTSALVDCFQCNEASGTVIANQCTPSRPATLSDSTAHMGTLVPVSLLT